MLVKTKTMNDKVFFFFALNLSDVIDLAHKYKNTNRGLHFRINHSCKLYAHLN